MTDPAEPVEEQAASTQPLEPKRRIRWKLVLLAVIGGPIALFALYTFTVLNWSYSDGDRAGVLYKFSRKGWICKTWEGELNITPGAAAPTIWPFTVRDDAVAKQINEVLGARVVLHYSEHLGVPTSCFGETTYFVDGVRVVKE
jgi:hypothetical protein